MRSIRLRVALTLLALVTAATTACGARLSPQQIAAAERSGGGTGSGSATGAASGSSDQGVGAGTGAASGSSGASGASGGASASGTGGAASSGSGPSASSGSATRTGSATPAPAGGNGGATDVGVTANSIELGNVSTLTGPVPGLFAGAVAGAQAYIAYQNSLGGVYGRNLHLQVGDDQLDAAANKAQIDGQIPKVFSFLGSFSVNDQAGAADMQAAGVPDVGYSLSKARSDIAVNFSPQPTGHGWRLGPLAFFKQMFGPSVITKCAFFTEDVQSAIDQANNEKAAMTSLGYKIVYQRQLEPTEQNFTGDVLQMQSNGVKCLMLSGEVGTMARMAQTMHNQGFTVPFANWGASAYDPQFIPQSGGGADGSLIDQQLALYAGEDAGSVPEVSLFLQWLHRVAPGQKADIFAAFSWASGKLLVDGLKAAGAKLTRAGLIAALKNIHAFNDNGLVADADPGAKGAPTCWVAIKVQGGKFVRFQDPPAGYRCQDGGYFRN